ncbi:hypothetical protein GCK32_014734 [Trichostrongylus colubriformis]|uniref:Uncharacterized protein n=1 Tax=Trichostrongylus colubriformis TaxID=6319 RepID=A0AAN8EY84_TRICO
MRARSKEAYIEFEWHLKTIGLTCLLTYLNTIGLISNLDGVIVFMIVCAVAIVVRYQTAENLRVARLLNKLMVLYVCFFITENLYYYVILFVLHYGDVMVQEILLSVFTTLMVAEMTKSGLHTLAAFGAPRSD